MLSKYLSISYLLIYSRSGNAVGLVGTLAKQLLLLVRIFWTFWPCTHGWASTYFRADFLLRHRSIKKSRKPNSWGLNY